MIPRLVRPVAAIRPASRHGLRQYSLSAVIARCSEPADWIALGPVSVFQLIHDTGLPWFAAIPMSAVAIRSLITYPLLQRPLREMMVDRAQIQPLVDAHMSGFVLRHSAYKDPVMRRVWLTYANWWLRAKLQMDMFDRAPGVPRRTLMFAVTIAASEAFRRMAGAREGLLRFLMAPVDWVLGWFRSSAPDAPAPSTAEAGNLADSVWFDPTLTTEGFSWCSDLTAADPTLTLPILFSATFFYSIYFAPRIDGGDGKPTNGQRIGMTLAMLSIFPALHMPAGLLLYFIANIATNNVLSRWLALTRPIYPAPKACSRPVRMQRSNEIAEDMLAKASAKASARR